MYQKYLGLEKDSKRINNLRDMYRGSSLTLYLPQCDASNKFFLHMNFPTPRNVFKKLLSDYRGGSKVIEQPR